jgi:hypothetical protein
MPRGPKGIRLFIALGIIGAVVGVAVGFVARRPTSYCGPYFADWVTCNHDAIFWMTGGIIVGVATAYIRALNSN